MQFWMYLWCSTYCHPTYEIYGQQRHYMFPVLFSVSCLLYSPATSMAWHIAVVSPSSTGSSDLRNPSKSYNIATYVQGADIVLQSLFASGSSAGRFSKHCQYSDTQLLSYFIPLFPSTLGQLYIRIFCLPHLVYMALGLLQRFLSHSMQISFKIWLRLLYRI